MTPSSTPLRCPKCRSRDMCLTIEAMTTWSVVNGRLDFDDGIHDFGGAIGNVQAVCMKCSHSWRTRSLVHGLIFPDYLEKEIKE